jgi:hypothetical protein
MILEFKKRREVQRGTYAERQFIRDVAVIALVVVAAFGWLIVSKKRGDANVSFSRAAVSR